MPDNTVYIAVDGIKYSGWKKLSIKKSMESLANSFSLTVTDEDNQLSNSTWKLQTQKEAVIRIGGDKIITGFIDSVRAAITPDSHEITVAGRDKTADLIDCSYTGDQTSFSKINFLNLATELIKPFNIPIRLKEGVNVGTTFRFTVNSGETVFAALERKARELGILLLTDPEGNLLLSNNTKEKADDSLIFGNNIISGDANYTFTNRFSVYIVRGQRSGTSGSSWGGGSGINVQGIGIDDGVSRTRPLIIRADSQMDSSLAERKAEWEALTRAAKSETITVMVQGFRQSSGALWDVNKLVDIYAPPLYANPTTEMLITNMEQTLDENGTRTKLTLKRADAYVAEPKATVKKQKNLGWG